MSARDRRWVPHLAFAVIVIAVFVGLRLILSSSDGLAHIERFEDLTATDVAPQQAFFGAGLEGDGATGAIVALDPFGTGLGSLLFEPTYRYSRFGYAWLSRLFVAGSDHLILLGLSLVGFASIGGLAFLASALNDELGWRSWLLIANPALALGVLRDTPEPLAALVVALALLTGSGVFGAALAATRPSFVVALAGSKRAFAAGVVVAILSRLIWSMRFELSFFEGGRNLDWPGIGIVQQPSLLGWLLVLAALFTAITGVLRRNWSWLLGGLFVTLFAGVVFYTPTNAIRAAGYLPVLWAFGPNWVAESREAVDTDQGVE